MFEPQRSHTQPSLHSTASPTRTSSTRTNSTRANSTWTNSPPPTFTSAVVLEDRNLLAALLLDFAVELSVARGWGAVQQLMQKRLGNNSPVLASLLAVAGSYGSSVATASRPQATSSTTFKPYTVSKDYIFDPPLSEEPEAAQISVPIEDIAAHRIQHLQNISFMSGYTQWSQEELRYIWKLAELKKMGIYPGAPSTTQQSTAVNAATQAVSALNISIQPVPANNELPTYPAEVVLPETSYDLAPREASTYQPTRVFENVSKTSLVTPVDMQSIVAMASYQNWSLEELQWASYLRMGRSKVPPPPGPPWVDATLNAPTPRSRPSAGPSGSGDGNAPSSQPDSIPRPVSPLKI